MATHAMSILGPQHTPASGHFWTPIVTQLTTANNDIDPILVLVLSDTGADTGLSGAFTVPENYVGTPKIRILAILDGLPSDGDNISFTYEHLSLADNASADAAFGTPDLGENSDAGSTGTAHGDEDLFELDITLSNNTTAAGEMVLFRFDVDSSANDFSGNILVTNLLFVYNDA